MSKIINFKATKESPITDGNLALDVKHNTTSYEKPKVKKLVKKAMPKKIFMGCWQCCNEVQGDGC